MSRLSLRVWTRRFAGDESGTTAIEYALIASGVAVAIAGTIWNLGSHLETTFYSKLANLF